MVSTTQGTDPGRVTAIMFLAGVEPIFTAAPNATRDIMSGWNLGGGGPGGEGTSLAGTWGPALANHAGNQQ